jgi:hypothetical protein
MTDFLYDVINFEIVLALTVRSYQVALPFLVIEKRMVMLMMVLVILITLQKIKTRNRGLRNAC